MATRMQRKALLLLGALFGSEAAQPPVDVVVAHFNEDLNWVRQFMSPDVKFSIYSKSESPPKDSAEVLPNVGRESHTYLHHIVKNYDNLAPWTVFTQGTGPAWGYRSGDSSSGHLTDNITFADYLDAFRHGKDAFFAISAATHIPRGVQSTRLAILTNKLKAFSNSLCPADGADGWSSWWFDAQHPHFKAGQEMLNFYHRYVLQDAEAAPKPTTLGFVQGARFGLSRTRIQARSLAYYKALLEQVSKEVDPVQGYFMEAMWYDVFHPEGSQAKAELCTYPQLPVGSGLSVKDMYVDTARRLNSKGITAELISPRSLQDAYNPPTPAPTPAPTLAPTPAPTPAPTSDRTVTGSLVLDVPDATPFTTPGAVQDALKASFAIALAAVSGAPADDISVEFSLGRRLGEAPGDAPGSEARALRRRLGAALMVDYTILVRMGSAVTAMAVSSSISAATPASVLTELKAAIEASGDVPQSVKDDWQMIQVTSISVPSATDVPSPTPAPTPAPTPEVEADHAHGRVPFTAVQMLTMAALLAKTSL